jgi:hypothetical protein
LCLVKSLNAFFFSKSDLTWVLSGLLEFPKRQADPFRLKGLLGDRSGGFHRTDPFRGRGNWNRSHGVRKGKLREEVWVYKVLVPYSFLIGSFISDLRAGPSHVVYSLPFFIPLLRAFKNFGLVVVSEHLASLLAEVNDLGFQVVVLLSRQCDDSRAVEGGFLGPAWGEGLGVSKGRCFLVIVDFHY